MPSDRLFGPSLTTPAMADAVSDTAWLAAMLRFEAKLAAVEAQLELIPPGAATAIAAACDPGRFDVEAIGQAAAASATPVVPMVDALRREVGGDAVRFVHYGATSQDVLDTPSAIAVLRWSDAPCFSRRGRSPSGSRPRCG